MWCMLLLVSLRCRLNLRTMLLNYVVGSFPALLHGELLLLLKDLRHRVNHCLARRGLVKSNDGCSIVGRDALLINRNDWGFQIHLSKRLL